MSTNAVPDSVQVRRWWTRSPFQRAACTRQTPHQPPSFPLPAPSIIFFHHLQTLQGTEYMFSASYYGNITLISFFFFFQEKKQPTKKQKHTNGCVLGPQKGSECFVVDVARSWPFAREQSFTCFIWCCKHSPVARIWFYLHRDGRRHTCDTKGTILLKSLKALEPAKMIFFFPLVQNKC